MGIAEEIERMAEEIEAVIKSNSFLLGDKSAAKRLKFIANNYLVSGSYAKEKAHDIATYADDFCKRGANQSLILAKINDRLDRIKGEAMKYRNESSNS